MLITTTVQQTVFEGTVADAQALVDAATQAIADFDNLVLNDQQRAADKRAALVQAQTDAQTLLTTVQANAS